MATAPHFRKGLQRRHIYSFMKLPSRELVQQHHTFTESRSDLCVRKQWLSVATRIGPNVFVLYPPGANGPLGGRGG